MSYNRHQYYKARIDFTVFSESGEKLRFSAGELLWSPSEKHPYLWASREKFSKEFCLENNYIELATIFDEALAKKYTDRLTRPKTFTFETKHRPETGRLIRVRDLSGEERSRKGVVTSTVKLDSGLWQVTIQIHESDAVKRARAWFTLGKAGFNALPEEDKSLEEKKSPFAELMNKFNRPIR